MLNAMSVKNWLRSLFPKREYRSRFDLGGFREQLRIMENFGSLGAMVNMIPGGAGQLQGTDLAKGEREFQRMAAMIDSMPPEERRYPKIIDWSRRLRIAEGSGSDQKDVAELLHKFGRMKRMKWPNDDDDDDDPFTPLPA